MGKGTDIFVADLFEGLNLDEIDKYGGWGLNLQDYTDTRDLTFDYSIFKDHVDFNDNALNLTNWPLTPENALKLTTEQIRNAPFFKRFNDELNHQILCGPKTEPLDEATVQPLLPHLLGHAIPALSDATGRNVIPEITNSTGQIVFNVDDNIDMSIELRNNNKWPEERDRTTLSPVPRWQHNDLKVVAYLYVIELYKDFVIKEANLNK